MLHLMLPAALAANILGGEEIGPDKESGALLDGGGLRCGAVRIAPDVLLTAAHCIGGGTLASATWERDDTVDTSGDSTAGTAIAGVAIHPDYTDELYIRDNDPLTDQSDIALVFLDKRVGGGWASIGAEPIPTDLVHFLGWGTTTEGTAGAKQIGRGAVYDTGVGEFSFGGESQACVGDDGGPVYNVDDELIGIISRRYSTEPNPGCEDGAIAATVAFHEAWIAETMLASCADGRRPACRGDGALRSGCQTAPGSWWWLALLSGCLVRRRGIPSES